MLLARHCCQPSRRQQPVSCQRSTARRATTAPGRRQVVPHVVVRAQAVEAATAPPESPAAVSSMDDGNLPAAGDVRGGAAMDAMASSGKVKDDLPARRPYVPSGAPETTWYCWPDGFIGQSFSLAGKLQPRASPLLEDTETLYQFAVRRREMCRYSEHTIDSAESASEMVEAVVGGSVDMGMFNASGSVSLEMSREFSTRAVSHNLVASFQENELLEMVRPSLTEAAKGTLMSHGPDAFAARYGTHFVSGVGHRGAFIGSITVKLSDASTAVSGSASFKVGYAGCTGMAELKASMKNKLSTSDVTFRWHKWGVEDDESLALLEQYCATDDAKFSGMKRLAMHTADQAKGYPKLIKLRPYHTLPDYVEACSRYCMTHGQQDPIQLQEQEQALSYLTQQYRKASYIKQVTDNDRRLSDVNTVGLASTRASLAYQVRGLIRFMEEVFRSKPYVAGQLTPGSPPSMYQLCTYFKYTNSDLRVEAFAGNPDAGRAFALGRRIKEKLDEVDRLNFELFKTMQRPLMNGALAQRVRGSVHVAAACDARPVDKGGFGRWWLDYQEQETFTQKGLYLVRLAWNPLGQTGLQQVGKTKHWDVGSSTETATSTTDAPSVKLPDALLDADRYIRAALADGIGDSESNVFVMFMVGINPEIKSTLDDNFDTGRHRLGVVTGVEMLKQPRTSVVFSGETWGSWASISYGITSNPDFVQKPKGGAYIGQGVYAKSGSSGQRVLPMMSESNGGDFTWGLKDADMFYDPTNQQPATMVLVEQHLQGPPDVYATGVEELPDSDIQIDAAPLEELEYRLSTYPQPTDGDADVADGGAPDTAIQSSTEADALPPAADAQPPAAATAAAAGGRLVQGALEITTSKSWADGDGICTQFDIKVTNRGPDPANSMKLQVTPPAGTELVNSWNCTRLADEAGAWAFDMPDWAQAPNGLGPGAELTVGLVVKGPALDPAAVLLLDT